VKIFIRFFQLFLFTVGMIVLFSYLFPPVSPRPVLPGIETPSHRAFFSRMAPGEDINWDVLKSDLGWTLAFLIPVFLFMEVVILTHTTRIRHYGKNHLEKMPGLEEMTRPKWPWELYP